MPLARAWWRGSAWALAATLVVPGALAIAIATIALGGGLRSLGAVAQIVTGPKGPEAQLGDQPSASAPAATARPPPPPGFRGPRPTGTATAGLRAPTAAG